MVLPGFLWYSSNNKDVNRFHIPSRHNIRNFTLYGRDVMFLAHITFTLGIIQQQIL